MVRNINCKGCGACVEACEQGALSITREGGRKIDWGRCTQCLACTEACIYHSLNRCGRPMAVDEILDEVMRDEAFYNNSGGGITVSGGEALSQSEFVASLLEKSKHKGLHTVIDTAGYAPWNDMKKVLRFSDLVLFDIKHLDSGEHKRTTGVGNEIILENLIRASRETKIWLRVPLISGFNDSERHIREIAILGRSAGVQKISLLPYHEGGRAKSEQMGKPYGLPNGKAPDDQHMENLKELIEKIGLTVGIRS
jgi:pyruvate formate lyase activating enzyme